MVIAIIAIIAAILFPVFARAREKGRQAVCTSNLRQMGIAIAQYTQDFDGGYPNGCSADFATPAQSECTATGDPYLWTGQHFRWLLMSYLGFKQQRELNSAATSYPWVAVQGTSAAILVCPSDPSTSFDNTSYGYSATFYHADDVPDQMTMTNLRYAKNSPGVGGVCVTRFETEVKFPSQKVISGEFLNLHVNNGASFGYWGQNYAALGHPDTATCWQGGRNYLFADGHCKQIQAGQILPSQGDPGYPAPDIHRTHLGLSGQDIN